jgi:hypothetical protein
VDSSAATLLECEKGVQPTQGSLPHS